MTVLRGIWSEAEHDRFLEAIQIFPRGPWRQVAEYVGTRDVRQVQTHAQKYYEKIGRHIRGLRKERRSWVRSEHRIDDLPSAVHPRQPLPVFPNGGGGDMIERRLQGSMDAMPVGHYAPSHQDALARVAEELVDETQPRLLGNARTHSVPDMADIELPTLEESLDILLECLSDY